jgi:transketolase
LNFYDGCMATATTTLGYEDLPRLLTLLIGDEKHDASSFSTLDVLWVLYDRVLRVDPSNPDDSERDRFLLSKGHGPTAYYAVLAAKGFLSVDSLAGFGQGDSVLGYHPDRMLVPGVEISSGSLGHGLPIAVGAALGLDTAGPDGPRVICLVGDAELEEGSNFEAIQLAGRLALGRLTVVVVDNGSSMHGWPGGIEGRFELEGWSSVRVDGRDHDALERAFVAAGGDRPHAVVAEVRP